MVWFGGAPPPPTLRPTVSRLSVPPQGALELLLLGTPAWLRADPLAGYHYTGEGGGQRGILGGTHGRPQPRS